MIRTTRQLVIAAIILAMFPLHSLAQIDKKDKELGFEDLFNISMEDLMNVGIVSASKKKQSVADAPATAYVYRKEDIQNRGYFFLVDLLEDVPEVEIQRNASSEFRNVATIRGISGNEKFMILLNGVRITPPTGDGYTLGNNFSLANAERVEIIIGPASALYGVDAFSGIINIITVPEKKLGKSMFEVNTGGGNYGTSNTSFVAHTKLDRLQLSLTGNYYQSAEPDYYSAYPLEYGWYNNRFAGAGKVVESPYYEINWDVEDFERWAGPSFNGNSVGTGFEIPTSAYFVNADLKYDQFKAGFNVHEESHNTSMGLKPKFTTYDDEAWVKVRQSTAYVQHDYTSFNKKWGLQTLFRISDYEIDPLSHMANYASRYQRGYFYSYAQSHKVQEQLTYDFSRKISFVGGASYENIKSLPRTGLSPSPINPDEPFALQTIYYVGAAGYASAISAGSTPTFDDSLTIEQEFYHLNYQNYGAFGQLQLQPFKTLNVILGSRYDFNTRYGGSVNPRAGVVYTSSNKKLRAKLLYGEAFLAPSPRKSFEQNGGFFGIPENSDRIQADFFRVANPDLQPEKLRSAETSVSYLHNKTLAVSVNAFYTSISNLINLFGEASTDLAPDNLDFTRLETSINTGISEVYGGTFKVDFLKNFGAIRVNFNSSYSYIDGFIDEGPLLYQAKHTIKGGADVTYRRLNVSPRILWRSESYSGLIDAVTSSNFKNGAFGVLNLTARYGVYSGTKSDWSVFVKANNLLDQRYYHVFVGSEGGMPQVPQDPIRIMGGVQWKLK